MRTQWRSGVALAAVLVLGGCGGGGGGTGQPDAGNTPVCTISGVSLTGSAPSVAPSQAVNLTATVTQGAGSSGCNGGVVWNVNPSTTPLNISGLTATFTTAVPGAYTINVTSKDDTTKSASFQLTVRAPATCGTPNGTVVTHTGNITADESWAGNGVTHSVTSSVRIKAPATVTIQACAIVSLAQTAEIGVEGDPTGGRPARLVAAGTDDQTGFVSFLPAVTGQFWGTLRGYNEQSFIELHHAGLVGAGAGLVGYRNSAIVMEGPGLNAPGPLPLLTVDHVAIDHPRGGGVYLDGMAAFTAGSTWLGIGGAQDYPLSLFIMAAGSIPQMTVQDDPAQATHFHEAWINPSRPNVIADTTINGNIPLYLEASVNVVQTGSVITPLGVTLTVLPGAELRFKPGANLRMMFGGRGNTSGNAVGRLIALGTATSPIRFTSAAAVPAAGDWAGVQLPTAPGSQMAFNIIEYAGGFSGVVSNNCRPSGSADNAALIVGGPDFTPSGSMIVSSIIQFSAGHGIDATWEAGTPNDPNLADSANFNVFTAIGGCKQTFNALVPGVGSCPTGGGCTEQ
ncbi:MAG TPA: hypothetical protein VMT11_01165 [Myxococcaceae bacterium]|nr:hypothetical protein [Myxococcaceae bacterium]